MFKAKWVLGTGEGIETVKQIRQTVFVNELGYATTAMLDDKDSISASIIVLDENDLAVATGRLYPSENGWKLGRIAVLPQARKQGYGELVIRMLALKATETSKNSFMVIDAAKTAIELYRTFGFAEFADPIIADGVTVTPMRVWCQDFIWNKNCQGCHPTTEQ